jgi:hypothetical protein
VEQASAAAASFEQESARLLEVVSRFKTDRAVDRGRVIEMVKQAVQHLRKVGAKQACADFNDRSGPFVHGEYYIFALGLDGKRLAYAPDTRQVGTDSFLLRDADGRAYGRDIVELGKAHGFGWCDLKILNPKTGKVEPKSVYVERVQDVVLGCGIYRSEEQLAASPVVPRRPYPAAALPRLDALPSAAG